MAQSPGLVDRLFGDRHSWSVLGAGASQMRFAAQAAAMACNVPVGLKDSLWLEPGQLARTNAGQVTKVRGVLDAGRVGPQLVTPPARRTAPGTR